MVVLGGWRFLISEVPLYLGRLVEEDAGEAEALEDVRPRPHARRAHHLPGQSRVTLQTSYFTNAHHLQSPAFHHTLEHSTTLWNILARRAHHLIWRFRGGLVLKACVSLNSRLESNKEEEKNASLQFRTSLYKDFFSWGTVETSVGGSPRAPTHVAHTAW